MSLIGSIGSALSSGFGVLKKSVSGALSGAVAGGLTGGLPGAITGASLGGLESALGGGKIVRPAISGGVGGAMSNIGGAAIPGVGFTGSSIHGMTAGGARSVSGASRAAGSMCARYPSWCVSVGGVGAVQRLMLTGQLPIPRRRRRRGITPKDLSSFRRVANLIKAYSAPVRHTRTPRSRRK